MMKKILAYLFVTAVFAIQVNGQVNWTKHPGNPVLPKGVSGAWDDVAVGSPTIIYNGTTYQMWYNGSDGSNANIGYATSSDKINWDKHPTPVLEHGPNGSWDDVYTLHPSVYFDGTTYHMWYTGVNGSFGQIGYATSPDSINWTKYSGNPVLTLGTSGSWDDQSVNSPDVLFIDGVFHMWYAGFDGSHEQIGHATSLNGINWEKDTLNPVLKVGDPGSWNNASSTQPSVLYDGTKFHMWYGGGPDFSWRIGYAYSEDGRIWQQAGKYNPVLGSGLAGDWDGKYVGYHIVRFNSDSTGFDMWYTGAQNTGYVGDIGYATAPKASFDFENNPFIKYSGNQVLKRGTDGTWDDVQVGSPTVMYDGIHYHMWYNGNDGSNTNIGYASSTNKIKWDKYPTPVLENGPNGSWDDVVILHPTVYFDGTIYHMWYTGSNGSVAQIGYATSPDSINWTKYPVNPVLTPGEPGSWDDVNINSPDVLFIDGLFYMWYRGFDGNHEQIGHATSLNGIDWQKDTLNPVLKVGVAGSWDNANVSQPSVLFDGTYFHMWYGGGPDFDWRIGYAYSEDGRNWHKDDKNNPVLGPGLSGDWDSKYVGYQTVSFNSDSTGFDMWYTAASTAGYVGDIGFAFTIDYIPPVTPTNVEAIYKTSIDSIITVIWDKNSEEDLSYYTVYRKVDGSSIEKIAQVSDTFYVDNDLVEGTNYLYSISATDYSGNESALSNETTVAGLTNKSEVLLKFSLSQNYPNPFNPTTKIKYQVPTTGLVSLQVYNLLGEVVTTLVNEEKPAGTYEVDFNSHSGEVRNLPSGVYFYRLQAGNFVQTKKMLLLK